MFAARVTSRGGTTTASAGTGVNCTPAQVRETWAAATTGNVGGRPRGRRFPGAAFPGPGLPLGWGSPRPRPRPRRTAETPCPSRPPLQGSGRRIGTRSNASHGLLEGRGGKGSNTAGKVLHSLDTLRKLDGGFPPPARPVGPALED